MSQSAVKLPTDVVEDAKRAADIHSRSKAGQILHWVRIGRAIERSPRYDQSRVEAALRADIAYDDLSGDEQRVYLDRHSELMSEPSEAEIAAFKELGKIADRFDASR